MKTVVKTHCIDAGLQVPEQIRECKVTCPEKNTWHVNDWTDVSYFTHFLPSPLLQLV